MDMNVWNEIYSINKRSDKSIGFLYIITTHHHKYYIGKKLLDSKGKWKWYTGSSNELNQDIANGIPYNKYILYYANRKSDLSYLEAEMQFDNFVLINELSYNGIINCRVAKHNLSEEFKLTLLQGLDFNLRVAFDNIMEKDILKP